ncbi:sugar O-acyltransferase, sialic acid O-acetyltransferase NeuD family [Stutzerimonas kunmingensis]|uniref:acetyltransferase n=1 Tax=Stutzerimonas kunmingensis TaxID=1211807 RepID=UPI0008F44F66|nr:acetyltransferase [Stutzerimonas kunmingensis]MCQ2044479.1 acetyltransferase [Stutzerimonas kunmingensis]SFJ99661.1 sugar O-acyltransferase, sialic acid O-acetyltransferase NeuD family [Stutzerimonas kunmingensis]
MDKNIYAVFGASGFGREVMPLVRGSVGGNELVFVDDNISQSPLNGHEVMTYDSFLKLRAGRKYITIAIADAEIREKLTERCLGDGIEVFDVTASNVVLMDEVSIGEGAILCPFTTITSNVKIGKSFHANIYSYIAHDCVVGDYVTFAPSVKCNGNVVIEDYAYVGTGAIIKQGRPGKPLRIGKGAVVGMGAVVTKDVAEGAVVVGNPAKPLARKGLGG